MMSHMLRTSASSTWRRGAASRCHHLFRIKWASRCCRQFCSTLHFVCGSSGSPTSLSTWAQVLSQRCWICCAINASLPSAVPQATMPTAATVTPSLAATFRALSGSAQYTSVFHDWHAWRLIMRRAPATTASSCPCRYVSSWHAVTIASDACSCAACSVGWYVSANSSGPFLRVTLTKSSCTKSSCIYMRRDHCTRTCSGSWRYLPASVHFESNSSLSCEFHALTTNKAGRAKR